MTRTDDIIPSEWWPNIECCIAERDIPAFPTKAAAQAAAKAFGWKSYHVLRVMRRFENVWIVGMIHLQPDCEAGIEFKNLRVCLLKWEKKADGVTHCPTVQFRKPMEKI